MDLEQAAKQDLAFRPEDINILIVDDNRHMRVLLREHLFAMGFKELMLASDGEEALNILKNQEVDLVIADYKMPKMDGIELLQTLRTGSEEQLAKICYIILTGHADRDNVIQAKGAGVNGFLVKPISIRALAEQLVRALNERIEGRIDGSTSILASA